MSGRAKRILIIEDDPGLRAALSALFRKAQYDTVAVSVREGIEWVRRNAPVDLIIADLWGNLPDNDHLLEILHNGERRRKVICLSAFACPFSREENCRGEEFLSDAIPKKGGLIEVVERMLQEPLS